MNPILNYATVTRPTTTNWPWLPLLILAGLSVLFAPSAACACWKGEYKVDLVLITTALLFLRTLIAILRREQSLNWLPYLAALPLSYLLGPTLLESLL